MSNLRYLELGDLSTQLTELDAETVILRAKTPLAPYPGTVLDRLIHWAELTPDTVFIAQRDPQNRSVWRTLTYKETLNAVRQIASGLVQYHLSVERPLAILSGNSIEHALIGLAAMYLGIPYAPISPQYSLASSDFSKLKHVIQLITPGMVFVDNTEAYAKAIAAAVPKDTLITYREGDIENRPCIKYKDLLGASINTELDLQYKNIQPDDVAKFLFSSGSTGSPKAVINTHRMLAANQQMIVQAYPFLKENPVLLDWLPWNHTFGGNHNVGIALFNGGSYFIDEGKPAAGAFPETIRNLKEIAPTVYFNVPKGFELLVKHLREDAELRKTFFSKLKMLFYAGAGISQPVWDALEELALEACGERIMILTGLGCTETSPSALFTNRDGGFAGFIGLPLPGLQAKLKRVGEKYEIRFRGDNVTPGYWRDPELTAQAFDQQGFYKTGDAVKFVDSADPQKGLQFDGRISEDFKLNTGTWVSAGPLRAQFLNHFGPLVKDVVIVGRDRPAVAALVFPDIDSCREFLADSETLDDEGVLAHENLRKHFTSLLRDFAARSTGSSNRIVRLLLQRIPPSLDKHEITDKGSLNSNAIQDNRKQEIELLYQNPPVSAVIVIE